MTWAFQILAIHLVMSVCNDEMLDLSYQSVFHARLFEGPGISNIRKDLAHLLQSTRRYEELMFVCLFAGSLPGCWLVFQFFINVDNDSRTRRVQGQQ